ncbi:hypothetical protein IWW38_000787 [Coemansia aciculifera]|uniref:Uncharacterized protein n=1 Tax=Coemansia aciculifera TaxID=417176 RepID=A0ACC1M851_9FUNG|nr:hypothetical protein IWW38_000787 [Coemansia aciculifera]
MTGAVPAAPAAPAAPAVQETPAAPQHKYTFRVKMACGGCSGAIKKALTAYKSGAVTVDQAIPVENIVSVTTALPREEVLQVIVKTGKTVFDEPPAAVGVDKKLAEDAASKAPAAASPAA